MPSRAPLTVQLTPVNSVAFPPTRAWMKIIGQLGVFATFDWRAVALIYLPLPLLPVRVGKAFDGRHILRGLAPFVFLMLALIIVLLIGLTMPEPLAENFQIIMGTVLLICSGFALLYFVVSFGRFTVRRRKLVIGKKKRGVPEDAYWFDERDAQAAKAVEMLSRRPEVSEAELETLSYLQSFADLFPIRALWISTVGTLFSLYFLAGVAEPLLPDDLMTSAGVLFLWVICGIVVLLVLRTLYVQVLRPKHTRGLRSVYRSIANAELETATEQLTAFLATHPEDNRAQELLIHTLLAAGRIDEAYAEVDRMRWEEERREAWNASIAKVEAWRDGELAPEYARSASELAEPF